MYFKLNKALCLTFLHLGVWLHENGVLGASPDGLIRRAATHNYNHLAAEMTDVLEAMQVRPEILEVKCPFTARNMTIPEANNLIKEFCLGICIFILPAFDFI